MKLKEIEMFRDILELLESADKNGEFRRYLDKVLYNEIMLLSEQEATEKTIAEMQDHMVDLHDTLPGMIEAYSKSHPSKEPANLLGLKELCDVLTPLVEAYKKLTSLSKKVNASNVGKQFFGAERTFSIASHKTARMEQLDLLKTSVANALQMLTNSSINELVNVNPQQDSTKENSNAVSRQIASKIKRCEDIITKAMLDVERNITDPQCKIKAADKASIKSYIATLRIEVQETFGSKQNLSYNPSMPNNNDDFGIVDPKQLRRS